MLFESNVNNGARLKFGKKLKKGARPQAICVWGEGDERPYYMDASSLLSNIPGEGEVHLGPQLQGPCHGREKVSK